MEAEIEALPEAGAQNELKIDKAVPLNLMMLKSVLLARDRLAYLI